MVNKSRQIIGYVFLIGIFILSACQNDPLDINGGNAEDFERYLEENSISATKAPEGYYYEAIQVNENGLAVENGDIVSMYYTVTHLSGDIIDEHLQADGEPVKLQHDDNAVLPVGIDIGVGRMRKGEIYRLYIPSGLAYQSVVSEEINSHEAIIAEIEVVDVLNANAQQITDNQMIDDYIAKEGLDNVRELSSGLRIRSLNQGNGTSPNNGEQVTISYTAKFTDNTIFAEGSETVTLGDNILIQGMEEGVRNMRFGEKALLIIPSNLAYGASVRIIPQQIASSLVESKIIPAYAEMVPPFKVLVFEVTLQQ